VSFAKGAECFKGSEIDKNFGINNLTKTLESIAKRLLGKAIPGLDQVKLIKGIIEKGISGMEMD